MYLAIILLSGLLAYMVYLSIHSSDEENIIKKLRSKLAPVDPLFLTIPIYPASESFTNKEVIYLCLKSHNGFYNDNTLIRVLLHEMAHVRLPFVDTEHTSPQFKRLEENYLRKASQLGIYNPKLDFPCDYCGNTKSCHIKTERK